MTETTQAEPLDITDYSGLGLVANPFVLREEDDTHAAVRLDMLAHANRLKAQLLSARQDDRAKPILVSKNPKIPSYYPLHTIGDVESFVVHDESLNMLHAYVQMYMLRAGRIRATLRILGERLAFRGFDITLARYIEQIIEEPDETLASYQLLGPEKLGALAERFAEDPLEFVTATFGESILERQPALAEVADIRATGLDADVEETDDLAEIDGTVGDPPGTGMLVEGDDSTDEQDPDQEASSLFVDYVVEHARVHYSPVIARAIRVYRDRGLGALPMEFRITNAPRKTLAAVARFARIRFDKVVIVYDGFDDWDPVPSDLKTQIAASLTEIRWILADEAVIVAMLPRGEVPELEEAFGTGPRLDWDFGGVVALERTPDVIDRDIVNGWIEAATLAGASSLTLDDPVLSQLEAEAEGSLKEFALRAAAAIDDAASRGAAQLDKSALEAGQAAGAATPEEE